MATFSTLLNNITKFMPVLEGKDDLSNMIQKYDIAQENYEKYKKEIRQKELESIVKEAERDFTDEELYSFGKIKFSELKIIYSIIREEEPSVVVETGVCNGASSLFILAALKENGLGHLYSIDMPFYTGEKLKEFKNDTFSNYGGAAVPRDKEPGWIVPERFRGSWDLRLGKSQVELPKLRTELEEIDVFVHDSEHSKTCMTFEYELGWNWLSEDGFILSDDINWNNAFDEFVEIREANSIRFSDSLGLMRK